MPIVDWGHDGGGQRPLCWFEHVLVIFWSLVILLRSLFKAGSVTLFLWRAIVSAPFWWISLVIRRC